MPKPEFALQVTALADNIALWGGSGAKPMTWENTLRAAAPSPGDPKGTIVLLPGQGGPSQFLSKVITRPIYEDAAATTVDEGLDSSTWGSLPGGLLNTGHLLGHTDNHVVRIKDGSFIALKSTFYFAPPGSSDPWKQLRIREIRSPYPVRKSGRGCLAVWHGSGNPLAWQEQGRIDVFDLAYQYPRPLDCSGVVQTDPAKQCKTKTAEEDLWTCAGLDRPELYACPFTGYLYATVAYYSGPYEAQPFEHDDMLLCSTDKGVSWKVVNDHLGGPAPHVMTSTPNGRLFVYAWTSDADNSYGHLHCSNLFDASKHELPVVNLVKGKTFASGGAATGAWEVMFGQLYTADLILSTVNGKKVSADQPPDPHSWAGPQQVATPAISRASTDTHSSRVRLSLWFLNEFSRVECGIIELGVVDQVGGPHVEQGSLRLVDTIAAADRAHHSVMNGSFIDPDYIDTPSGFASNTSMFYWLDWPCEPPVAYTACATNSSGDVQIVVLEADTGRAGHTIRLHDGSWPYAIGDVTAAVPGPPRTGITPACACDADGNLHLLIADDDVVWHTIRQAGGSWPQPWENVVAKVPDQLPAQMYSPACACDQNKRLHVLAKDEHDTLYHTFRNPDGSWPYHFGDVAAAVGDTSHGGFGPPACAADHSGNLHVLAADYATGKLWHTIRYGKDGSWLQKWGDVVANVPGQKPGRIAWPSCALTAGGALHIVVKLDKTNELWHTVRDANGHWTTPWTLIQKAVPDPGRAPQIRHVTCAVDPNGVLHVLAVDNTSMATHLQYTYRETDGSWPLNFTDVTTYVPPSARFPNQMSAQYKLIDGWPGEVVGAGPLSVKGGAGRTWLSYDPGGHYMTGGFFHHNGLNYVPQWTERSGTYANIVHVGPPPLHPISPIPHR